MMTLKYTLVAIAVCFIAVIYAVPSEYDLFDKLDDQFDELIELEPRFSIGIFNGLNRLSDQLRNKIRAVKEWEPVENDGWNCSALSKVDAVQTNNLEQRTPELRKIEEVQVTDDYLLRKAYKSLVKKIKFWETMPLLLGSRFKLQKHVDSAESTKKELIKLYENKLNKYLKAVKERMDSIRSKPMGPEFIDTLLPNGTKINYYSKAEERILLKSIEAVSKCLKYVNVSDIYRKYQRRATNILNDSNIESQERYLKNAKLSINLFFNDNDNEEKDDDDDDADDDYNQLPVSPILTTYIQAIDKTANLIADTRKSNVCQIDKIAANSDEALEKRLPSIEASMIFTENFYDSVRKHNENIQNHCDIVKNLAECDKAIADFKSLVGLNIYNQIAAGYNTAIASLTKDNLGARIDIDCDSSPSMNKTNTLKSSAQFNKALEIYKSGVNCLQAFGKHPTKSKVPEKVVEVSAFNNNLSITKEQCATELKNNTENIQNRLNRMERLQEYLL